MYVLIYICFDWPDIQHTYIVGSGEQNVSDVRVDTIINRRGQIIYYTSSTLVHARFIQRRQ